MSSAVLWVLLPNCIPTFSFALHISKSLAEERKMCCCQLRGQVCRAPYCGFSWARIQCCSRPCVWTSSLFPSAFGLVTCLADCWENCLETWIFPTFPHVPNVSVLCVLPFYCILQVCLTGHEELNPIYPFIKGKRGSKAQQEFVENLLTFLLS